MTSHSATLSPGPEDFLGRLPRSPRHFCRSLCVQILITTGLISFWFSTAHAISSNVLFTPTGAASGDVLGTSVASAGDFNGDGYDDVIVGAYQNDAGGASAGRAYVYYGGPNADDVPDLILTGAAASDFFGYSVASAGDVNGDGFADVIVGAYGSDAVFANGGRAYVYFGGPSADAVADLTL